MQQTTGSAPPGCPRARGRFVDRRTGELRPARCLAYGCGWCGPRLALATVSAIVLAAPAYSAVVTLHPADEADLTDEEGFGAFSRGLSKATSAIRSSGTTWEMAWVLERSAAGRLHAHVLQSGDRVSPRRLAATCSWAGFGWSSVAPIRVLPVLARYVLKVPLRGLDLPVDEAAAVMRGHLDLNGGRLLHSTRAFWTDVAGHRLGGVRLARSEAFRASLGLQARGEGSD